MCSRVGYSLSSMQEKFTTPEARLDQHQAEMRVLKAEVRVLKASAERYAQIRGRFLENFRRYVVSGAPINANTIHTGDNTAHEGDAVADALIYRTKRRSDPTIFRLLYGFSHDEVLKLEAFSNFLAIRVINEFGTLTSHFDPIKTPPHRHLHPDISSAFTRWMVIQSDDLSKSSDDQGNRLGQAYWQFFRAVHAHA